MVAKKGVCNERDIYRSEGTGLTGCKIAPTFCKSVTIRCRFRRLKPSRPVSAVTFLGRWPGRLGQGSPRTPKSNRSSELPLGARVGTAPSGPPPETWSSSVPRYLRGFLPESVLRIADASDGSHDNPSQLLIVLVRYQPRYDPHMADLNRMAFRVVQHATEQREDAEEPSPARRNGRVGGVKGGKARAEKLCPSNALRSRVRPR
jgi:hypothetical protein